MVCYLSRTQVLLSGHVQHPGLRESGEDVCRGEGGGGVGPMRTKADKGDQCWLICCGRPIWMTPYWYKDEQNVQDKTELIHLSCTPKVTCNYRFK